MQFVKLGLADPSNGGEPLFYRRIPMVGLDTSISFLKRHAVLLARNEETGDIRNVNLNDYSVQLYYTDSDFDKILLCTDTDVTYAMQAVAGVTATVKITAKVDDAKPNSTKATQTATPSTTEATSPPAPANAAAVPTNNVVEAFEDVLNCVVASANAAMAASAEQPAQVRSTPAADPPVSVPVGQSGSSIVKAARTSSEALKMALEQAAAHTSKATHVAIKAAHYAEKKVDKAFGKAEKHVNRAVEKAEKQLAKTERKIEEALAAISKAANEEPRSAVARSNDVAVPTTEPSATPATTGTDPEAFIHGRHTCDACLTTPIIGDRYHATNMLDYDLCAKCHDQYKGSEIKFEVAKLDRDAPMQERWQRKYARLNNGNHDHHGRPNRRHSPRARFAHRGLSPYHHVEPHQGSSSFGPGSSWTGAPTGPACGGFGVPRAPGVAFCTTDQFSTSALHASHPYFNFGTKACNVEQASVEVVQEQHGLSASNVDKYNEEALAQALRRSLEDMELSLPAAPSEAASRASAPKEEEDYEPEVEIAVAPIAPPTSNGSGVVVETVGPEETCDEEASVVEALVAAEESITNASTEQMVFEVPVESHDRMPEVSVSQSASVKDIHENETVTEAGETIVSGRSEYAATASPSSPKATTSTNVSFVEQDSSSIENFLGETLDRVANAIDNLMIVDGTDDDDDDEEAESQGSWSVVNDDENLARAAEMIGSALFHSDNNVGSTISSVSSAPTHVTNIAQFHRWSHHLERLHELGFEDDVKNIAVLEMLMAANIVVEAFDEDVTLEQAVNALMNGN